MPYFVLLGKWTERGVKNVRDAPRRVAAVKAAVEKSGARWRGIYYTFGEYDFVAIIEQARASDASIVGNLLRIAGEGNVRTTTLKGFSLAEARKIFSKLPRA